MDNGRKVAAGTAADSTHGRSLLGEEGERGGHRTTVRTRPESLGSTFFRRQTTGGVHSILGSHQEKQTGRNLTESHETLFKQSSESERRGRRW